MRMAREAATMSTCLRRQVGAVLVLDNRIISTGRNGAPSKCKHCAEVGCIRQQRNIPSGTQRELCRGAHAEANAVTQVGRWMAKGSTLYCTNFPCSGCAKTIINGGVVRVVYSEDYNDGLSKELLAEAGVEVEQWLK